MRKFWEKGKSIEDVHVPAAVEYDFTGVAVAAEQVANPLLLARVQEALAVTVAVERRDAAQEIGQFPPHLGNVPCLHLIKDVREADGHTHLLNGAEVLALAVLEHGGQDALVVHSVRRGAEAGLIAQALVPSWAFGDVADGPVAGYLIEVEVFVHFYSHFGNSVQI